MRAAAAAVVKIFIKMKKKTLLPIYDSNSGQYFLELKPGQFRKLSGSDLRLHLRRNGLSDEKSIGTLNEVENALAVSQIDRAVDYSGPLAGHNAGTFDTSDGRKILVTQSPRLPIPKRGKWPFMRKFFSELLGEEEQWAYAWLSVAFKSLAKGDMRPGQLLALAGDAGCGKSLFQCIVTEMLGGSMAKPYRYMIGDTSFNGDLARASHWCIEDEHGSTDIRMRRKFGTSIKDVCANLNLSIHNKGAQAITLPTFRRITLSVNRENENLQIIPPLDASLVDKIILLLCGHAEVGGDRDKIWRSVTEELPAFVWFLLHEFTIPKALRCPRYGVIAYQNSELAQILTSVAPENRLLSLMDEILFADETKRIAEAPVKGTTEQIEKWLRQSAFNFAVEKLLYFSTACGVYLQRLSVKNPNRVKMEREGSRTVWRIFAPSAQT